MSPVTAGLATLVPATAAALAVAGRALTAANPMTPWSQPPPSRPETPVDTRLWALQRLVGDHLDARHPTKALRVELRRLADRRLVLRHGIRIQASPERAAQLLGADVVDLLRADDGPRLRREQVDVVLERIEAL